MGCNVSPVINREGKEKENKTTPRAQTMFAIVFAKDKKEKIVQAWSIGWGGKGKREMEHFMVGVKLQGSFVGHRGKRDGKNIFAKAGGFMWKKKKGGEKENLKMSPKHGLKMVLL